MSEPESPLGDVLAQARQSLELVEEPIAEPLATEEPAEGFTITLNPKQNAAYMSFCNLAASHPNLLPVVAAEILQQQKHPGTPLSTTTGQIDRRLDAVRALQGDPEKLKALDEFTRGLVAAVLAMVAQMTNQEPPAIKIVHDLPVTPEA